MFTVMRWPRSAVVRGITRGRQDPRAMQVQSIIQSGAGSGEKWPKEMRSRACGHMQLEYPG